MENRRSALLALLACGFMSCLAPSMTRVAQGADAAMVNGKVITTDDVENAFKRTSVSKKSVSEEQGKMYRRHVLQLLVDDTLLQQYLDAHKVTVADAEVTEHIEKLRAQLKGQGRSLDDFLKANGIDEQKMQEDIRNVHRWLAFVDKQATPETLKKYYQDNPSAFDGSEVRASHILVKTEFGADEAAKKEAKKKIEAVRVQLAGGTAFADAARKHSDCPSKDVGGDLNYFPRKGVMTEPFAAAAFRLSNGQISEIVETEFGYHLILVTDRKPGKTVPFEEVAGEVKAFYAEDLRAAVLKKMRANSQITYVQDQ
ncbi:MAG: peptidylprolyl isomerase [Planctomycetota bacterium]